MTGLTKNNILINLYNDKNVKNIIKSYTNSKYLYDELFQEVMLILMEMDENKLIKMYENKILPYWIVGIAKNQSISTGSTFYNKVKKFSSNSNILPENIQIKNNIYQTGRDEKIGEIILNYLKSEEEKNKKNIVTWYENELFRLYYFGNLKKINEPNKPMSLREIQKYTQIHFCSINLSVKNVLKKVIKHLKEKNIRYKQN